MTTRRKVIGVMGSAKDEFAHLAEPLGRWLAEAGYDLLTGGGTGTMTAVCRGFHSVSARVGLTIGILPAGPPKGYPNPFVDVVIRTHLRALGKEGTNERSRNHINILSSDVVIALPGRAGTRTEVQLALLYSKPVIVYLGPEGAADGGIEGLDRAQIPCLADNLEKVIDFVHQHTVNTLG